MKTQMIAQLRQQLVADVDTKRSSIEKLTTELAAAQQKLTKFDAVFGPDDLLETVTPRRKPGPKPGVAKAPKTPRTQVTSDNRAAEGRRAVARGDRPKIKDALIQVMASDVVNSLTIFERLTANGWLPNANDPRQYISYVLSSTKDKAGNPVFERVQSAGRGYYRVFGTKQAKVSKPATKEEVETNEVDQTLTDAGILPAVSN